MLTPLIMVLLLRRPPRTLGVFELIYTLALRRPGMFFDPSTLFCLRFFVCIKDNALVFGWVWVIIGLNKV